MNNKILNNKILREDNQEYQKMLFLYNSALKELDTRVSIISEEFKTLYKYNPIEHVKTRIKSFDSIKKKIEKKNLSFTINNIVENLCDIAGIRIICSFIPDVYRIAEVLKKHPDIEVIECNDYIENPKKSGYQSYHIVVGVPVHLSNFTINVKVEIQIRTIAMDFWASLEHKIKYKYEGEIPKKVSKELIDCAKTIRKMDNKMADLGNNTINQLTESIETQYKEFIKKTDTLFAITTESI